MALKLHLEKMKKIPSITQVAAMLSIELEKRFSRLVEFQDEQHDPIYLVATMLDPRYKIALEPEQIQYAKREFLKRILPGENISSASDDEISGSGVAEHATEVDTGEPEAKRPKLTLDSLGEILMKRAQSSKGTFKRNRHLPEIQLDGYLQTTEGERRPLDLDVVRYWNSSSFTVIALHAIDLLAVPSSSTAVERTFSTAGEATTGRRNTLMGENLEKEILLKKNKPYYMSMFWQ
jgi:hypothetical protein